MTALIPHKQRFSATVVKQIKVNGSLRPRTGPHDHPLYEMDPRWRLEGSRTTAAARLESMCQRFGHQLPRVLVENASIFTKYFLKKGILVA